MQVQVQESVSAQALVSGQATVLVWDYQSTHPRPPIRPNYLTAPGYHLASTTCFCSCVRCTSQALQAAHTLAQQTTADNSPQPPD